MLAEISSQLDLAGFGRSPERRYCTECKAERIFRTVMRYKVLFVVIFFGAISHRRYYFACSYCNNGPELEKSTVKVPLSKIPLPFMSKYGLVIGLCILLLVTVYQGIVSVTK